LNRIPACRGLIELAWRKISSYVESGTFLQFGGGGSGYEEDLIDGTNIE